MSNKKKKKKLTFFLLRIIVEIKLIPLHLKVSSTFLLPATCAETWTIGFKWGIKAWIENSHIDPRNWKQSQALSWLFVDRTIIISSTRGTACEYNCIT